MRKRMTSAVDPRNWVEVEPEPKRISGYQQFLLDEKAAAEAKFQQQSGPLSRRISDCSAN